MKRMKMKLTALMGMMTLALPALQAQDIPDLYYSPWTFGVRAGINASPASIDYDSDNTSKKTVWGFNAGFSAEYAATRLLFLESGLYFTSKGGGIVQKSMIGTFPTNVETDHAYNPSYVLVPLKVGFSFFPDNPRSDIKIKAGVYAGYGIGGNYTVSTIYHDDRDNIKTTAGVFNVLKRFDCGLDFGVDFELNNFVIGANYQLGLLDISKDNSAFSSFKNNTISVSIGYKFYF